MESEGSTECGSSAEEELIHGELGLAVETKMEDIGRGNVSDGKAVEDGEFTVAAGDEVAVGGSEDTWPVSTRK